jgi:hypothetical protein
MFDVCTTGDTAHVDMIFKFLPHTRKHRYIHILAHALASPSGRNVNYNENQLSREKEFELFFPSVKVS